MLPYSRDTYLETFINLCPHDITIVTGEDTLVLPSSGTVRLQVFYNDRFSFFGIEIVNIKYGCLQINLHNDRLDLEDKLLIVPTVIKEKAEELKKITKARGILSPNTAEAARDEGGNIISVGSLVALTEIEL